MPVPQFCLVSQQVFRYFLVLTKEPPWEIGLADELPVHYYRGGVGKSAKRRVEIRDWGLTEIPLYFGTKWGAFTGTAAHPLPPLIIRKF
jgi:hypothetical protein